MSQEASGGAGSALGSLGPAPDLTIVVVTWNVRDLALRSLESVYAGSGPLAVEVVVVDNASEDGTVGAVRERFPQAVVIENGDNVGFPRACNQGLERARGRYVLFLNPDTVVGAGTLFTCAAELDGDATVGMVGCRLVRPDGGIQYEGARRAYRLRHLVYELLYLHMLFPRSRVFGDQLLGWWDHEGRRDVEAICGAFMMVRRSLAEVLGGLPEDVFMYHEDLSFCLRVRRAGWKIRYVGEVLTVHLGGQSSLQYGSRLGILEAEHKTKLIEEGQGRLYAFAARLLFGLGALLRLAAASVIHLVPGTERLKERYPRAVDLRQHRTIALWAIAPGRTRRRDPRFALQQSRS
ncbi:MAG: glycosyltransferase family 2 protein [Gemmatimonadetes bacterium]|nr:glycosyltransferase family 2 protein [Gemmatimonadota bacterium]